MNTKKKKNLTYFTIGVFFFLGGVEYAVILPTVWLYIHTTFDAPEYMLGIIMSAFSLSGLIAGPLMGRWSDQTGQTKWILLFANLWEVTGSIMYFLGINVWFLVAARLVAGVGTGVGSAIFADITRVTSNEERTAVMAVFMAVRQIGLLVGPGFNFFLREFDVNIGAFPLNKYTAPGAFMAVLWLLLEVMVLFLYWDLPKLMLAEQEDVTKEQMAYTYANTDDSRLAPPLPSPSIQDTPNLTESEQDFSPTQSLDRSVSNGSGRKKIPKTTSSADVDLLLTSSNEMIESAERFICMDEEDEMQAQEVSSTQERDPNSSPYYSTPNVQNGSVVNNVDNSLLEAGNESLLQTASPRQTYDSLCDHGTRSSVGSHLPDATVIRGNSFTNASISSNKKDTQSWTWAYYYNEYFREEVIAILATVFVAFFNQVAMETMLTPLTQRLMDWGELENSLLYCAAGVEIMVVFALIRWLSRRIPDRSLLLLGFFIETVTVAFLLWYLPQAREHDPRGNLPWMLVGIIADLFGLPFLVVVSASLYSKITRQKTQGFSQGLRRSFGGLGCIMGPLWAGSLLDSKTKLYLMVGIMLGINMVVMGLKFTADRTGFILGPLWVGGTLNNMYLMIGVMLGITIMAWIMLLLSFSKLKEQGSKQESKYQPPSVVKKNSHKRGESNSSSSSSSPMMSETSPLLPQST